MFLHIYSSTYFQCVSSAADEVLIIKSMTHKDFNAMIKVKFKACYHGKKEKRKGLALLGLQIYILLLNKADCNFIVKFMVLTPHACQNNKTKELSLRLSFNN